MEKDALKLLVRQLRMLVDALESEVYSDVEAYSKQPKYQAPITDYEEVYDDDDGVINRINNSYRLFNDDDGDGL